MSENPDCDREDCDGVWNGYCDYICWCGMCPRGLTHAPLKSDGITLIARKKDSFKRLYEDIRDQIILPVLNKLPNKKKIEKDIHDALKESLTQHEHQVWPKDPELEGGS